MMLRALYAVLLFVSLSACSTVGVLNDDRKYPTEEEKAATVAVAVVTDVVKTKRAMDKIVENIVLPIIVMSFVLDAVHEESTTK